MGMVEVMMVVLLVRLSLGVVQKRDNLAVLLIFLYACLGESW